MIGIIKHAINMRRKMDGMSDRDLVFMSQELARREDEIKTRRASIADELRKRASNKSGGK